MYAYNHIDQQLVEQRVSQFRDQTQRYLDGKLDEEVFKQLRLRNGLYVQRHAPMLRVAVPYGVMNAEQMRCLASIAQGHTIEVMCMSLRGKISSLTGPKLVMCRISWTKFAQVQMHAIQTSGNCIRNVTSDPLAGVAPDELEDPRVWCELIRQWSTLHPEFSFLPRKFKFAVTGSREDRVASQVHDIGLQLIRNELGEIGFKVIVGGGLGRTPVVGKVINPFLPRNDLISFLEAILRVYNLHGRRDNLYKARIKILVNAIGIEEFRRQVSVEWEHIRESDLKLDDLKIQQVADSFQTSQYQALPAENGDLNRELNMNPVFATWYKQNTRRHKVQGYRIVYLSLKDHGLAPGDITDQQLDAVASLAEAFSLGEIRTTYTQNLVLAQVEQGSLPKLWRALNKLKLATPNIATVKDIICCPGFDFCALANATSIDVSEDIMRRFDQLDELYMMLAIYELIFQAA